MSWLSNLNIVGFLTPQVKLIERTRAENAASGDVAYTGVGFSPRVIFVLFSGTAYIGVGMADVAKTNKCLTQLMTGTTPPTQIANVIYTKIVHGEAIGGINGLDAIVKSYDADGFTLTWTEIGAGLAGTMTMEVLCLA